MYDLLRQRSQRAGDVAGVASYDAKIRHAAEKLRAEIEHRDYMLARVWQHDVDTCAEELADLQRTHDMLREYALETFGAGFESQYAKLSDDKLRQQAREWRSAEAQPSK